MRINVSGDNGVLSKNEFKYAMNWFGRRLMGRLSAQVTVNARFCDGGMGRDIARMRTIDVDTQHRAFDVEFNTRKIHTPRTLYMATSHESVHIWQYATRACREYEDTNVVWWRGMLIDEDEFSYHELPWEVEAYRLEKPLYDEFVEHLKRKNDDAGRQHIARPVRKRASYAAEVIEGRDWHNVVLLRDEMVVMVVPAKPANTDKIAGEWRRRGRLVDLSSL